VVFLFLASFVSAQAADIALANESLFVAEDAVLRMVSAGFSVVKVNQSLEQARNAFESGMYGQTVQMCRLINSTSASAFGVYSMIDVVQSEVDAASEKGFDVSDASDLLDIARGAFGREDYAEAERFANKARLANQAAGPGKSAYLVVAEVFVLLVVLSVLFYFFVYPPILRRRLETMKREEGVLKEKMRRIVSDYYESKTTRDEFEKLTKVSEYQLADLQGKIAYLESKLAKKEKGGMVKGSTKLGGVGSSGKK
jgi:hypothetical protein